MLAFPDVNAPLLAFSTVCFSGMLPSLLVIENVSLA
jgi:hypothetical protein